MSSELIIPAPQFPDDTVDLNSGFLKKRADVIEFSLPPLLKRDGSKLLIEEVDKSGYYIFREGASGGINIWDNKAGDSGAWISHEDVPSEDRELNPLAYNSDDHSWKGYLILMGAEDKYAEVDSNDAYYRYFLRCYFGYKDPQGTEIQAEGERSLSMKLHMFGEDTKAGLKFNDDVENPESVEYYIRGNGEIAATVKLEKEGAITIKNKKNNASIKIANNGDITVSPSGGTVTMNGAVHIVGSLKINNRPAMI